MKILRTIGMALFATMLCMNLSSCSSGGDDELIDGVNWSDQSDDDDNSQSSGSASYDDDDDDSQSTGSKELTVNGVKWTGEAQYTGDLTDNIYAHLVFCKFTRDDYKYYPSFVDFDVSTNFIDGYYITKGMDIATYEGVSWGSGHSEYELSVGVYGEDDYYSGIYGGYSQVTSGSAIISDYEDGVFLTIKFSNYTLPYDDIVYGGGNPPSSLKLDGTVTFEYTDSVLDL